MKVVFATTVLGLFLAQMADAACSYQTRCHGDKCSSELVCEPDNVPNPGNHDCGYNYTCDASGKCSYQHTCH
jgi:hypothetical protein